MWNVWYSRHLNPAIGRWLTQDKNIIPQTALDSLTVLDLLDEPAVWSVAYQSLQDAWQETIVLLGNNPQQWRWGDLVFQP